MCTHSLNLTQKLVKVDFYESPLCNNQLKNLIPFSRNHSKEFSRLTGYFFSSKIQLGDVSLASPKLFSSQFLSEFFAITQLLPRSHKFIISNEEM